MRRRSPVSEAFPHRTFAGVMRPRCIGCWELCAAVASVNRRRRRCKGAPPSGWVQRYAPILNQRIRRELRRPNRSWRVDETYVKVAGKWAYLYRAVDSEGE